MSVDAVWAHICVHIVVAFAVHTVVALCVRKRGRMIWTDKIAYQCQCGSLSVQKIIRCTDCGKVTIMSGGKKEESESLSDCDMETNECCDTGCEIQPQSNQIGKRPVVFCHNIGDKVICETAPVCSLRTGNDQHDVSTAWRNLNEVTLNELKRELRKTKRMRSDSKREQRKSFVKKVRFGGAEEKKSENKSSDEKDSDDQYLEACEAYLQAK